MLNRNAYLKSEVSTISQDSKCPPRSHTSDIPEVARVVCTLHVQHRMSYGSKSTCCARLPRKKEAIMSCLIFLIFPFPFFSFFSLRFFSFLVYFVFFCCDLTTPKIGSISTKRPLIIKNKFMHMYRCVNVGVCDCGCAQLST